MCEGDEIVPFSFYHMQADTIIPAIEQLTDQAIEARPDLFRVRMRIKPTNNLRVYIDGDNGVSIEDCIKVNRILYKLIEEKDFFPTGDFSLEVSSPGIDEPLLLHRQYVKNTGRTVEVLFLDGAKTLGVLKAVTPTDILLEVTQGKGKKAVVENIVIPFSNIKSTTVQVIF